MPALSHGHQLIYSSFYNRWNFLGFKILWINSWCYCLPTKIIPPPCTQGFLASLAKPAPFTVLLAILVAKVRKKLERNALCVKKARKYLALAELFHDSSKEKCIFLWIRCSKIWKIREICLSLHIWKEKPGRATMCGTVASVWWWAIRPCRLVSFTLIADSFTWCCCRFLFLHNVCR